MSATNRGGTRRALDAYYTPDDVAERLVSLLPITPDDSVIEPSCGGGAFVRALMARTRRVTAIDINPSADGLSQATTSEAPVDFLAWRPHRERAWCVGNPPFARPETVDGRGGEPTGRVNAKGRPIMEAAAQQHVEHALVVSRGVAFLLRLAFLESSERAAFWAEHPCRHIWVLSRRPSFTGGGTDSCAYGWFWWERGWSGPTTIDVLS